MRRRSFFLLEVLIAVILVGGFAYLSIHGAFQAIYKQKKMLQEIADLIEADTKRMDILEMYWNKVETLGKAKEAGWGYKVSGKEAGDGKYYLLEITAPKSKKPSFSYCVIK